MNKDSEVAVLGGGCFWCTEAIFSKLKGVKNVTPGYAGGHADNPTYDEVCSGNTGHAEVVKIEFDPKVVSYKKLLEIFFAFHDPTTLNRQGNDIGKQYRSIILFSDSRQEKEAKNYIKKLEDEKIFKDKIVTEVKALNKFFEAEDYHKKYFERNIDKPYCQFIISPKLSKIREKYSRLINR
ncbi:MAG: peptide-methionine (S)-S-oxide reductase MsrA [Patescibacteria group bacterium]|nr:peptide-methionine (S)-S-oxide reductase MsrA [Patescibacteria group bacterium]